MFRRSEDFTRPLLNFTDIYVEYLTHFGHRWRTLRTRIVVRSTLRDVYGRLRKFTWRISHLLDTVGGSRAFWTLYEEFTDLFCRQEDFTRRLRTFTWRISRILDTVGGLYGRVLPSGQFYATFTDVYGRLRGGSRAFWTS